MNPKNNICKIKSFVGGDPLPAITVNFDCGHLKREETSRVTCDILTGTTGESETEKQVLVVSRKNQLYSGTLSQAKSICNTLLLVRNKKTGKAKLVSSSSCQLLNCTYRGSSSNSSHLENSTGRDASAALAATFGSKRTKRRSEIAEKLKSTTASTSAVLEETLESINDTMEVESEAPNDNSVVSKLLPPCDRGASSLDDVYSIDRLLNERELEELKDLAELYMSPSQDPASDPHFLVFPFFKALGGDRSLSQVQLLLYANCLISFTRLSNFEVGGKDAAEKICMHSKLIGMKILKGFTDMSGTKRVRSPVFTDRAYCHAMVAIVLACDYKFNADWFFSALKGCRRKQLLPLLRVVGLVPISRGIRDAQYTHHLKLPLPPLALMVTKSRGNRM